MEIKIRDKDLGECTIDTYNKISKDEEYIIKSLAVLQIMAMNSKEDKTKFQEFVRILKECTQQVEELYSEEIEKNDFIANEQF